MIKVNINKNSVLGIFENIFRERSMKTKYFMSEFIVDNEKKIDVLLDTVDSVEGFSGVLGFVNGEEPGEGSIALHNVYPKVGDVISLVHVKQGIYQGNFKEKGKDAIGIKHIISYIVKEEDIKEEFIQLVLEEEASQIPCLNEN